MAALASQAFIPTQTLAQNNILEFDAIRGNFTKKPSVSSGQELKIVIINTEPLIMDTAISTKEFTIPGTQPDALALFGPNKQQFGQDSDEFVMKWPSYFVESANLIANEFNNSVTKREDYKRVRVTSLLQELCARSGKKALMDDNQLTVKEIGEIFTALEEKMSSSVRDGAYKTTKETALKFYTALATTSPTVEAKYTMKSDKYVQIMVTFKARTAIKGADDVKIAEPITLPKDFKPFEVIPTDARRDDRVAPTVFFSRITDGQYYVKSNGAQPTPSFTISERGERDDAQFYYGQMWHLPFSEDEKLNFAYGVGFNGQKLAYFLGMSSQLGIKKGVPIGYLSFGFMGVQAKRLDRASLGDPLADASTTIPTRDRFIVGLGLGISLRF